MNKLFIVIACLSILIISNAESQILPGPILLAPADQDTTSNTISPEFIWNRVSGSAGYRLSIFKDSISTVETLGYTAGSLDTSHTFSLGDWQNLDSNYYWSVRTHSASDDWGPYTEPRFRLFVNNSAGISAGGERTQCILYGLGNVFPNPAKTDMYFSYTLPKETKISISIYNAAGQLLKTLISGTEPAGVKYVKWDGRASNGKKVSSGVYIYCLKSELGTITKKLITLK